MSPNSIQNTPLSHAFDAGTRVLQTLRRRLDDATCALANANAVGGRLDTQRLDQSQVPSFDLAWAAADLLAAETALTQAAAEQDELERRLALLFCAEAAVSVRERLGSIALELGNDADVDIGSADLAVLRRHASTTPALCSSARLLREGDADVGRPALSEDVSMAQASFRRFAAAVVAPQAEAIHRHDLTVPEALLEPLREMGVFGLSIPETYGGHAGAGGSESELMVAVTEALSEGSLAAAGSLITRPEILGRALLAGGTEEQKRAWLPRIAAGKPLCGIAITEPDHGSDVASLGLKATRFEGGWLLNGAKTWCTFAGKAGVLMVVARTDPDKAAGHRGLSLMLVEKPSFDGHKFDFTQPGAGHLSGVAIPTIGYRGMHSFDLSFEDFLVPDANVIGGENGLGQGFYFTMAGMTGGRMQTAARASGVMRAALRAAMRYAADRKVFGAALEDYPLTQAKLARMAARLAACRRLTYAVARRHDAGSNPMEASLVKLLACRSAEWVTREALQIHGGMGYAEESAVSRYFVDARVLAIFEGAEETLALKVIARTLMERALEAQRKEGR